MARMFLLLLFALSPLGAQSQQPMMNLVFLGDSLTEGVPHFHGDVDTYPFMVCQQFASSGPACTKIGYRGQTTYYLREKLDGFLFSEFKPGAENVFVLWAGTNDLATGAGTVQATYSNLVAVARIAHAGGWQVVAVTLIARGSYFTTPTIQAAFPAEQAAINGLIRNSAEFDAVADPAAILTDSTNTNLYWDGTHLWPAGYQIVANIVTKVIQGLASGRPGILAVSLRLVVMCSNEIRATEKESAFRTHEFAADLLHLFPTPRADADERNILPVSIES